MMMKHMNSESNQPSAEGLGAKALAASSVSYLDRLNPQQREAVTTIDGPVLMLAGAGTGKTRALTTRLAHLIHAGNARPHEVLAVTFTNRAAREMKGRVESLLGTAVEGMPWLGTFHSVSARILRRHAELAGLSPSFTILDSDDQLRLLKQIVQSEDIDPKSNPPRLLASIIDSWKNRAWTPDDIPASESEKYSGHAVRLYGLYQERLKTLNSADFGDLLLHVIKIFRECPDVLAKFHRWLKYILVDEYQDTNVAQYLWLRLLATERKNICCVGDDDQAIYGWRGAEVGNILRFEKDFPGAKVIRLEQNYRSTPHILAAASALISHNAQRHGKTLWTQIESGEKLRLICLRNAEDEASWVGEEIETFQQKLGGRNIRSLDDVAILVRTVAQMRLFEDRFIKIGLPYRVIGGPRFYARMEIRDAIAYFRLAVSPRDSLAFERIANVPRRGLGDKSIKAIFEEARRHDMSLAEAAAKLVDAGAFTARTRNSLRDFLVDVGRWNSLVRGGEESHVAIAKLILDESGYTDYWRDSKQADAPGRLENLKELVVTLEEFENFQGFLDHVALVTENESAADEAKVSLMTLHAAKGLEFPVVFLAGWEDGLFPLRRSMDAGGLPALEEERRLAYVGITRSEQYCYVSFTNSRVINGFWDTSFPSRFVDELPEQHVEILASPGFFRRGLLKGNFRSEFPFEGQGRPSKMSPGMKRAATRFTQDSSADATMRQSSMKPANSAAKLSAGDRVFHDKFGYGWVVSRDGNKIKVIFDHSSTKMINASFLNPA